LASKGRPLEREELRILTVDDIPFKRGDLPPLTTQPPTVLSTVPTETPNDAAAANHGMSGGNASEIFRSLFVRNDPVPRDDVINKLVAAGISKVSAMAYLSWAKRENAGTPDKGNPWGFVIAEKKDEKGQKVLTRIRNLP
jgi:hypothetical protein